MRDITNMVNAYSIRDSRNRNREKKYAYINYLEVAKKSYLSRVVTSILDLVTGILAKC